jgi:hypothetical protein
LRNHLTLFTCFQLGDNWIVILDGGCDMSMICDHECSLKKSLTIAESVLHTDFLAGRLN